jgi:putative phage-type endonuclease
MTQALELSTKDVTLNREKVIGSSDIGTIMGVNPYKTKFELWCEKTGKIEPKDLSNNDAVHFGTILEDIVAQEYARRNNCSVRKAPKVYTHTEYPYLVAHADRLITGTNKGLECKTTSEFNKDKWKDSDIPESYILQCQWLMGLSHKKEWDIAVLIGGNKYKDKTIKFDEDLFDLMVKAAVKFMEENVEKDIPPELTADDEENVAKLYPNHSSKVLDLDITDERIAILIDHHETNIKYLQEIKEHIKQLEEEKSEIEIYLKYLIKDNAGIRTPQYCVTWKSQNGQVVFDKEAMIADGVYDKYATQTSFRRLNITKNKKSEVA